MRFFTVGFCFESVFASSRKSPKKVLVLKNRFKKTDLNRFFNRLFLLRILYMKY